jgi:hypothetical protein
MSASASARELQTDLITVGWTQLWAAFVLWVIAMALIPASPRGIAKGLARIHGTIARLEHTEPFTVAEGVELETELEDARARLAEKEQRLGKAKAFEPTRLRLRTLANFCIPALMLVVGMSRALWALVRYQRAIGRARQRKAAQASEEARLDSLRAQHQAIDLTAEEMSRSRAFREAETPDEVRSTLLAKEESFAAHREAGDRQWLTLKIGTVEIFRLGEKPSRRDVERRALAAVHEVQVASAQAEMRAYSAVLELDEDRFFTILEHLTATLTRWAFADLGRRQDGRLEGGVSIRLVHKQSHESFDLDAATTASITEACTMYALGVLSLIVLARYAAWSDTLQAGAITRRLITRVAADMKAQQLPGAALSAERCRHLAAKLVAEPLVHAGTAADKLHESNAPAAEALRRWVDDPTSLQPNPFRFLQTTLCDRLGETYGGSNWPSQLHRRYGEVTRELVCAATAMLDVDDDP